MRLKRANAGARVCALAFFLVLSVAALMPAAALALSEGRVYEMVTPVYKGGYSGVLQAAAPDGESLAFSSLGVFAGIPWATTGNAYVAHRVDGAGWSTVPLQPPFPESGLQDFSSTLDYALSGLPIIDNKEADWVFHPVEAPDTASEWHVFGETQKELAPIEGQFHDLYAGASGDLCHVMVRGSRFLPEAPGGGVFELYDLSRECGGEPARAPRLVAVRNSLGPNGEPEVLNRNCEPSPGIGGSTGEGGGVSPDGESPTSLNLLSNDGHEIFFTMNVQPSDCAQGVQQLFMRVGGERTVEVSRPLDTEQAFGGCGDGGKVGETPGQVPCPGAGERASAYFRGASQDGSRVFFTTRAGLVPGDTDGKNDLYVARIGCPGGEPACEEKDRQVTSLLRVSEDPTAGGAAEVFGVVSVAANGGGAYFVAHGVLSSVANGEGELPLAGAENLYAYDAEAGGVRFVADLCSGAAQSGEREDIHCPRNLTVVRNDKTLWGAGGEAQSTGDGRFLVFSSFAQLLRRPPGADTDTARDVYRFDMASGVLDRVSAGEAGHDANGNNSAFDASIGGVGLGGGNVPTVSEEHELASRAVSDDGSRVLFTTAEASSADARNGLSNVYIWHKQPESGEGTVSLISGGSALTNDFNPVITPSGRDVFFMTTQGLVPRDTENDLDVYDARIGGGFPPAPAERQECSGDACQGPLTNPVPLLVPGSVSQAPGGNFAAPALTTAKPKAKKPKKTKKSLKKHRKAKKSPRRSK